MESFQSDVVTVNFNGTRNDDGSSTLASLLENTHAPVSANTDNGEITTNVVNPNAQIVIPMESFQSDAVTVTLNGTPNDDGSSTSASLLENIDAPVYANTDNGEITTNVVNPNAQVVIPEYINLHRACRQALLEFREHVRAGFRARSSLLNVDLQKYKITNSTCPETKEHCSICLGEYFDGEYLAKIECGHMYHVDCIKDWNKIENTCPICKRRVSIGCHFALKIQASLARSAVTNQPSSGSTN